MKLAACISIALAISGVPSALAAPEQCRFIEPRSEREACYQRQEAALAEKRKQTVARDAAMTSSSPEQMNAEDAALRNTLRSICRGC